MALEGTLKDFSLADIFQLIGLQRKTGVLTLRGREDTVTVTFLEGRVVGADSLNKRLENRLGTVLVRSGMISNEQLGRALDIQKETLQRLGFILTHYGLLSQENLRSALQMQILQIIYRLFRWKDGDYHFSQETTIEYERDHVVPITAESILMEGARMIDEWPIIEKRIRSYEMLFRKKLIDQEIVVVSQDEAEEIDFDSTTAQRRGLAGERIKISENEKLIYDMVDGTVKVGEIIEGSRLSEFDTAKALYDLLTRDLIEEIRTPAPAAPPEPVTPDVAADVPRAFPLPLIAVLTILALASLATSFLNPANHLQPFGRRASAAAELRKAISLQRIESLRDAIEAYQLANNILPASLADLVPHFVGPRVVKDPWGKDYSYLRSPDKYVLIGFSADGRPDADLFLSHDVTAALALTPTTQVPRGGIELVD
jgi:hypothetical protein